MTVKEYLSIHGSGIGSVGIYDKNGEFLVVRADLLTIMPYLDKNIDKVDLAVFDETRLDYNNKAYKYNYIKACIYIDEEKEE